MKIFNIPLVVVLSLFYGCQPHTDVSFLPFQTFDEFSMKEVATDHISEPYLLIQRTKDTIRIVRSDHRMDTMIYLNKGNYWYSSVRITYTYSLLTRCYKLLGPMPVDNDYKQIDVYRYHMEDSVIEAFFHSDTYSPYYDGGCNFNEMGLWPDNITISSRYSSRIYNFLGDCNRIMDSTLLSQTTIWHVYQNHRDKEYKDTSCLGEYIHDYVAPKELMRVGYTDVDGNTIITDTFYLNALGIYHIPICDFSVDNGLYQNSVYGGKMKTNISCTTLETDIVAYKNN